MKLNILAFAAHPDDIELAASGTLMKHIEAGKKVGIIDLTQGELGSRGTIESRYDEALEASKIMGIHFRGNLKMADGFFEHSKENLIQIIEQIRRFKPEIILANAIDDRHPDHPKASKLVSEACFLAGLRKIETKWDHKIQEVHRPKFVYHYIQDIYLKPDFIVDVSEYYDQKMKAIKAYKTQFYNPQSKEPQTPISGQDFLDSVEARMIQFGRVIQTKYGEGFTTERTIGVNDFFDLI
ncbi:MAG: bacillithiol biosynthesis deacetylase BshB1 [Flavobacteriia bacterium]|nr:bacillithiol biosynthesis deacetylase BshB1 [Flavobacteriia bacterium]